MPDRTIGDSSTPAPFSAAASNHGHARDADRATPEGTARYRERSIPPRHPDFFRRIVGDRTVSSVGIGTYLGEPTVADDVAYAESVREAIGSGVNVIDTAINYRCQRSERVIGRVLKSAIDSGQVRRDELVISTKGGFIPLDGSPPHTKEGYQGYLRREFYARGVMRPDEVVAGGHCIAPGFLRNQVARSLSNLGVATVDVYFLHCPEQQLDAVPYDQLLTRLREAFTVLEERVDAGEIGVYGVATWNGLRTPPGRRNHLALVDLLRLATEIAGEGHHLRVVQLPINLGMPEAVRLPTQPLGPDHLVPALTAAQELGLDTYVSAPLLQGKLARGLPAEAAELLPGFESDAQRALAFARSLPVATALVGMRGRGHVTENLAKF